MIKGVIFDFDGLMVDTEVISYKLYRDLLKKYDIDFSLEDYKKDYPGKQLITNIESIKSRYHLDYDIDEAIAFIKEKEEYYIHHDHVQLKEGLVELLEYLYSQHIKIILATSSTKQRTEFIIRDYDIMKYFDDAVFGDEVENGKPAPDVFIRACEKIHIRSDEGLVLEDSENGIEAAYRANVKVICVPDMKVPAENYQSKCLHVYNSLYDVIDYLKRK